MVDIICKEENFQYIDEILMSQSFDNKPPCEGFCVITEQNTYVYTFRREFGKWYIVN